MKYLSDFRDPRIARGLVDQIRRVASRRWTLMEVCGGQTHSLLRHGIDAELEGLVEMIHGPGCPVCVTPLRSVDQAIALSRIPGVLLTSFGDMLRVPGSSTSLLAGRAAGGQVRAVYSPLEALAIARDRPRQQVVFFAVGFETTAPATALAVQQAAAAGVRNFSLLVAHVAVLPAMRLLAAEPGCRIDGFLAAGHVCTVTGLEHYHRFVDDVRLPVVVTGFEPVDLLVGILRSVELLESGRAELVNAYSRSVRHQGNPAAARLVDQVYQLVDAPWRGFGSINGGGLRLRPAYRDFDAQQRFAELSQEVVGCDGPLSVCRSGDVLAGRIKPPQCEAFGTACRPQTPLGAPMVSSEGACAAYYRYAQPARPPAESLHGTVQRR